MRRGPLTLMTSQRANLITITQIPNFNDIVLSGSYEHTIWFCEIECCDRGCVITECHESDSVGEIVVL